MEKELYPAELEGLNLNFTDAIYAIAFDLADEMHQNQEKKYAILDHFGDVKTRAGVVKSIIAKIHRSENRALQRVLGDLGPEGDEKVFHEYSTLKDNFREAISELRTPETRFALLGSPTWETKDNVVVEPKAEASDNVEMYAQVSQLMAEVRLYDQKRDEALSEIQELLGQLVEMGFKEASELKEDTLGPKIATESKPELSLDGPIVQLDWSYRSLKVLNERGLSSVCLAVEFFGDFQNFVDDGEISLREWAVIASTLRRAGLLEDMGGDGLLIETTDTSVKVFKFDSKLDTKLRMAHIRNIDNIMRVFADGYNIGLARMREISAFGKVSQEKFLRKLATCRFRLDIDECIPTESSSIDYLDFNIRRHYLGSFFTNEELRIICEANIQTIGQLLAACRDQRRFHNLKDIDQEAYELAVDHLRKYGFMTA